MLDPVEFGKAMASIVREATTPLLKRIEQLEARQPEKGDPGSKGEPGKDAPPVTDEQISAEVAKYLGANPVRGEKGERGAKGEPGVDAPPVTDDQIYELVGRYLKQNPPPRGEKGDPGERGPIGKAADPVDPHDVARLLLDSEDLESLVELRVKEEVAKIPAPKNGKDGELGQKGDPGPKGEKGDPGKDGAGIQDMLIDREGSLVATFTDGRTKSLGVVVGKNGEPGKNGKDGADFTEVRFEYDGERTLKAIGKGGEIVYRLPIPIDRGYWRAGEYEKGDIATEGGTAYIAIKDTAEKPTLSSGDWRILARKGRDGKDGRNGIDKTAAVKVNA